jgi:hypothetical protein
MAVTRSDLLWIYSSPATNIMPANAIANIALANWLTSFIYLTETTDQAVFVNGERQSGVLSSGVHQAPVILKRAPLSTGLPPCSSGR